MRVVYNRKLNEKPKIFKFFEVWEFFFLVIALVSPIVLASMLNFTPSFIDSAVIVLLYMVFVFKFKLGRPEGYFIHWLNQWFRPKHLRPGHVIHQYPVKQNPEPLPTRQQLADTEKLLLGAGLVCLAPGRIVLASQLDEDILEIYKEAIEDGTPLSVPLPEVSGNDSK